MELIDKDILLSEIEKRMQELHPTDTHKMQTGERMSTEVLMWLNALTWVKKAINSIETKDVDLEKELKAIDDAFFDLDGVAVKSASSYLTVEDVKDIARYFFELGCKCKK